MNDIYKSIGEYKPNKKPKILIVFDGMIVDMLSNKKLNQIVAELLIRGRKLNISLAFITQFYFAVTQNIRLGSTHYFKFQTKENFNKLRLIIHQILTFKTFCIFTKNVMQNHILFWLLILLFQKESFRQNIKTNHDN